MTPLAPAPLLALLTDFGLHDWYVAAMKGEILARLPGARILDLTHEVPPQQVLAGRFVLGEVLGSLPAGTIVCAVVDPGVGTARRPLCGWIGDHGWSGPDNGLLTPLWDRAAGRARLHIIENAEFRAARRTSATFHGRDLFAPAAAALAHGLDPALAGAAASDPVLLPLPAPEPEQGGSAAAPDGLRLRVLWVDRFGNLITNLHQSHAGPLGDPAHWRLQAGALGCQGLATTYGDQAEGQPLAYWGSGGWLEIGVHGESAACRAGLGCGDTVELRRG